MDHSTMRMKRCVPLLLGAAWACAGGPVPAGRAVPAPTVIDNCVTSARLSFRPGVSGVLLDTGDGAEVSAAIVRHYPVMQRDGLYPEAIALWRRPGGDWVYATLMQKAAPPHAACFTANVKADSVAITPVLLKKYFREAP